MFARALPFSKMCVLFVRYCVMLYGLFCTCLSLCLWWLVVFVCVVCNEFSDVYGVLLCACLCVCVFVCVLSVLCVMHCVMVHGLCLCVFVFFVCLMC